MSERNESSLFRDKAYLELCLGLIEEAYQEIEHGRHDVVGRQLLEILEIFEREGDWPDVADFENTAIMPPNKPTPNITAEVIPFPKKR